MDFFFWTTCLFLPCIWRPLWYWGLEFIWERILRRSCFWWYYGTDGSPMAGILQSTVVIPCPSRWSGGSEWPEARRRLCPDKPACRFPTPTQTQVCCWPLVLGKKRRQVPEVGDLIEGVDLCLFTPEAKEPWGVYFSLEVLTAVPLSRVIWKLDLSAPKNMGPSEKLSRG